MMLYAPSRRISTPPLPPGITVPGRSMPPRVLTMPYPAAAARGHQPARGGGTSPPTSPATGSALWLKGDVDTYSDTGETTPQTTNGGVVKGWKDQSGNARDLILATVASPTLATSALNGLSAVDFHGNQILSLTYAYGRTFDLYLLIEQVTWEGGLVGIVQDNGQNTWALGSRLSGGASPELDWYNGSSGTHLGSGVTLNTWFVLSFSAKGSGTIGTWESNQGGASSVVNPMTGGNPTKLQIGPVGSGGAMHFKLVELLLYTSNLATGAGNDRDVTQRYLGGRGGLF